MAIRGLEEAFSGPVPTGVPVEVLLEDLQWIQYKEDEIYFSSAPNTTRYLFQRFRRDHCSLKM